MKMLVPRVDSDRCLRYRWRPTLCAACEDVCPHDAIHPLSGLEVDADRCTGCMSCVAACPSDGIRVQGEDFEEVLTNLSRANAPVLGCTNGNAPGHERVVCLGTLAAEHLVALAYLVPDRVGLNATQCTECRNSVIVETLSARLRELEVMDSGSLNGRLWLIRDASDLRGSELPSARRHLFAGFGRRLNACLAEPRDPERQRSHSGRSRNPVPERRRLLNRAIKQIPEGDGRQLGRAFEYRLAFGEDCDGCRRCASVCPTRALHRDSADLSDDRRGLGFRAELCSGCGLCAEFCPPEALSVVPLVNGPETSVALDQDPALPAEPIAASPVEAGGAAHVARCSAALTTRTANDSRSSTASPLRRQGEDGARSPT